MLVNCKAIFLPSGILPNIEKNKNTFYVIYVFEFVDFHVF